MPRIRIKETDKTSSSTSGLYSNYAVLITGYTAREVKDADGTVTVVGPVTPDYIEEYKTDLEENTELTSSEIEALIEELELDEIQPDSNGAYEFNSADDFKNTIGLKGPKVTITDNGRERVEYHYGNQMAYELLKLGYPIVYKPIKSIKDMDSDAFWEVFKDKVNYDFRFISHGLLTSSADKDEEEALDRAKEALAAAKEILESIKTGQAEDADDTALKAAYTTYITENSSAKGCECFYDKDGKHLYESKSFEHIVTDIGTRYTAAEDAVKDFAALYITTSTINNINGHIANLAFYAVDKSTGEPVSKVGRGDCIALIELDEKKYINQDSSEKATLAIAKAISEVTDINDNNGSYCAMTVPSVIYKMTENTAFDKNKKFPGAFHYLACFISSINSGFAEWYAAAGYTRGIASYMVDKATVKLGEVAINTLEPRTLSANSPKFACNVITNFRGVYYLWGNRTALQLDSEASSKELVASHFLNIRQLCTTIKKQLQVACRRFTFDPSSDTLWFNFINAIKPTLEAMKADQGIRDYKILKVADNTQKAAFKAKIRIIPIEAVEDFDLEVSLEDSFSDITINE